MLFYTLNALRINKTDSNVAAKVSTLASSSFAAALPQTRKSGIDCPTKSYLSNKKQLF